MATELIAGTLHFGLVPIDPERSQQPRAGIAGQLFQVATKGRAGFSSSLSAVDDSPDSIPPPSPLRSMQTGQNSIAPENLFPQLGQVR
jgi:hypothetical protein